MNPGDEAIGFFLQETCKGTEMTRPLQVFRVLEAGDRCKIAYLPAIMSISTFAPIGRAAT